MDVRLLTAGQSPESILPAHIPQFLSKTAEGGRYMNKEVLHLHPDGETPSCQVWFPYGKSG